MTPEERELMNGMVNCYHACHANFEDTVEMVGSGRGLSSEVVKEILERLKQDDSGEYKALRQQLPDGFPL